MVRFGVPGQNVDTLSYADGRLATVPSVQAPRRPTVNDKKFPLWCEWRVNKEAVAPVIEGEFWKLIRFESNGDATWVQINAAQGGTLDDIRDQVNVQVTPDGNGNIDIDGNVVNNAANPSGIPIETVADVGTNTLDINLQVAAARTGAPGDKNDAGICSFDDTAFAVDGDGYVTLKGGAGPALDSVDVDFNSGAGTDPVVPDANGQMSIFGNTVTNATNTNAPVASHSRAANQFHIDVQLAAAVAATPADPNDVGLASFNNTQFTVDGNGFVSLTSPGGPGAGVANLGISLSAGTFKITGSDGTALSATNPGYVTLPTVANPGRLTTITITDDHQFVDDNGTSTVAGMLWGTTSTVDWGNDMPFYIYAIMKDDDTDVAFGITRSPANEISYAASNIGVRGSVVTTSQNSFFLLDKTTGPTSPTVGDYDGNPSLLIGSFRMRKTGGANNDWTVQALGDQDGIGRFNWNTVWSMPTGVNGSTASTYFQTTTGTQPQFSSSSVIYHLQRSGLVYLIHEHNTISVAGTGAGDLRPTLPCSSITGTDAFRANRLTTAPNNYIAAGTINGGNMYLQSFYEPAASAAYTNATMAAGNSFTTHAWYKGFN